MNGAKQNYINMQLAVGFSFPWGSGGLRNCILALLFIEVGGGGGGVGPQRAFWMVCLIGDCLHGHFTAIKSVGFFFALQLLVFIAISECFTMEL